MRSLLSEAGPRRMKPSRFDRSPQISTSWPLLYLPHRIQSFFGCATTPIAANMS